MNNKLAQSAAGVSILIVALLAIHFLYTPEKLRSERIFVYGTLTSPVVRSIICGCVATTSPATLSGYVKVGRNIIPEVEKEVHGQVFFASTWELGWFDWYERTPDHYRRELIDVAGEPAWVYVKNK